MCNIHCVSLYFDVIRCAGASYLIFAKTRDAIWSLPGLCEGFITRPPSNFLLCLSTFRIFFLFCLYSSLYFRLSFHSVGHLISCRFSFPSLRIFCLFLPCVLIMGFLISIMVIIFFSFSHYSRLIISYVLGTSFSLSDIFILFCFCYPN